VANQPPATATATIPVRTLVKPTIRGAAPSDMRSPRTQVVAPPTARAAPTAPNVRGPRRGPAQPLAPTASPTKSVVPIARTASGTAARTATGVDAPTEHPVPLRP